MGSTRPINILVYTGEGATPTSVRHVFYTFRKLLSPYYVVLPVSSTALLNEPWLATCVALVMPGGADLPYCRILNGAGNRRIRQFVQNGGKYIGLCAGAYYASGRCEFMEGDKIMEVIGDRELGFFPGVCRGLAFKGFKYQSEAGARAALLEVNRNAFHSDTLKESLPDTIRSYYNGGGVFVDASQYGKDGVEVLASYAEQLDCNSGKGSAAIIYRKVGKGGVLLTAPHPEFAAINLDKNNHGDDFKIVAESIEKDEEARQALFKACLIKVGLQVNKFLQPVPSLSPLYLSSLESSRINSLLSSWKEIIIKTSTNQLYIKGENDKFYITNPRESLLEAIITSKEEDVPDLSALSLSEPESETEKIIDYDSLLKHLIIQQTTPPSYKETPSFNHATYYNALTRFTNSRVSPTTFGATLLYGEVVTSTSTLLEKNHSILRTLPTGFTATASTQLSGRGRGSNVWASPAGSLMFSTVIWHPVSLASSAPVVFVQYLAAMAVVLGVRAYGRGYDKVGLRLKWPNDVYAPITDSTGGQGHVKVSGVLVNSTYNGESYGLVVGVGVNVANAAPTTGLDALAKKAGLEAFVRETLLARILASFEDLYRIFCAEGWGSRMEQLYYEMWLHKDQIVTVESEGGLKARIKGVTRDWGLLLAEELGWEGRPTGHTIALQSDNNSFDFFKGLIKRKI